MNKLGFLVKGLGASQLSYYLLRNVGRLLRERDGLDAVIFYESSERPCLSPPCAIMPAGEAWGYDGAVVATSLSTASKLLGMPGPRRKFFYVWDLEWVRHKGQPYRVLADIYRAAALTLLARSQEHAEVISSCWNVKVAGIVEDVDPHQLYSLCLEEK